MPAERSTLPTLSRLPADKNGSVPPAKILKWVPPFTEPGEPDLFYINHILSAFWQDPDGSLPRLGNPDDPLDDLVFLMLTRRSRIHQARSLFEALRARLCREPGGKPEWGALLDEGVGGMAREFHRLGMGRIRARGIHLN